MKGRKICCVLTLMLVLLAACGGNGASLPVETEASQPETEASQPETEAPQPEAEPPQPEAALSLTGQPPTETGAPLELQELLEQAGLELERVEAKQLIIVRADGTKAQVYSFEVDGSGQWQTALEPAEGHVGKNGVTANKTEGDKKTPAGLFSLTLAFGVQPDPGCAIPYRQVTGDSYWVDDPDSRFYNQWVEGTEEQDWDSAEHLSDYSTQYAYAAVVDYNTEPIVPGAGSAIFLHCGTRPTAGCVSVPEEAMLGFLKWLEPADQPAILIF